MASSRTIRSGRAAAPSAAPTAVRAASRPDRLADDERDGHLAPARMRPRDDHGIRETGLLAQHRSTAASDTFTPPEMMTSSRRP